MSEQTPPPKTTLAGLPPEILDEYGPQYFERYNYADRPLGRYSMYWFARRYYAALVRRYAPAAMPGSPRALLELGCGLGHLLSLLQDDFVCTGVDLAEFAVRQTQRHAPRAKVMTRSADDLDIFTKGQFKVVVALHLVEHLPDPAITFREVTRILSPGGLFLFATPNPGYTLRRYKDTTTDAIGKDPTHINCQPPAVWRRWSEAAGLRVLRHFGDGLWDVPYLPVIPRTVQFGLFGLPALLQVLTRTTFTPINWGVNQIVIARKEG